MREKAMNDSPFHIQKTAKSFDEAVQSVIANAKEIGFNTVAEHKMHETYAKNNLDWSGKYEIISICNPQKSHHALLLDLKLGCFMPKNIIVFEDENKNVNIMFMKGDPQKMDMLFPGINIGQHSAGVISDLISIINKSI